jgi:hypothetical protein
MLLKCNRWPACHVTTAGVRVAEVDRSDRQETPAARSNAYEELRQLRSKPLPP